MLEFQSGLILGFVYKEEVTPAGGYPSTNTRSYFLNNAFRPKVSLFVKV